MGIKKHLQNIWCIQPNTEGSVSLVYVVSNGKYVIKVPKEGADKHLWSENKQTEISICAQMKYIHQGKEPLIHIPEIKETLVVDGKIIALMETCIGSGCIKGHYTREVYEGLPIEAQDAHAYALASFLNDFHQAALEKKICTYAVEPDLIFTPEQTRIALKDFFDSEEVKEFQNMADAFKNRNSDDEPEIFIHFDIRHPNLLLAPDGKIALIDFEVARKTNVYYEFAQMCKTGQIGFDFTHRVVDYYNSMPKKTPLKIDMDKVMLFATMLTIWHEKTHLSSTFDLMERKERLAAYKKDMDNTRKQRPTPPIKEDTKQPACNKV